MSDAEELLREARSRVDAVDDRIVGLLNERAELVLEIAKLKDEHGVQLYSADREKQVYERVTGKNKGPLPDRSLRAVYRELMSGALTLQKQMKVCYLGPPGTFTHLAAEEKFGSSVEYVPAKDIPSIFAEVKRGGANYGVVPVENSTEGAVTQTLDVLTEYDLNICAELILEIHHNLMTNADPDSIEVIFSQPQVFAQCRRWIANNYAHAELVDESSTSAAARRCVSQENAAAIASQEAAKLYGLKILAANVEDRPQNATRFLMIAADYARPTGNDKTSITFLVKDEVGALYNTLVPFKNNGINLTRIESRPAPHGAWDYYFFVDLQGHCEDPHVKKALDELSHTCRYLQVLGSYPAAG
jgi:chorismate mutase/prephenate dehydratase